MIPHEQALVASYYGKYFARNLSLYILQRRPEEWRNMQSEKKRIQEQKSTTVTEPSPTAQATESPIQKPTKRKRPARPDDEIDDLFNATLGKKIRKAALASKDIAPATTTLKDDKDSKVLQDVLGAMRAAAA